MKPSATANPGTLKRSLSSAFVRTGRKLKPFRRDGGSAITEFGPALLFLLLVGFFPLLDLAAIGLTYCSCSTLNDLQADKAKLLPRSMADDDNGPVKLSVVSAWRKSGVGAFTKLSNDPVTEISYIPVPGSGPHVHVATTCTANPFMAIPFIPGVPGISAPITFTMKAKRLLEDPTNVNR
jgi:hypothetical protein